MIFGLTGSMAAGKSTAAQILKNKGFTVIDADKIAHKVIETHEVKAELRAAFGDGIFTPDGAVNHRALAGAAFETGRVAELNAITHPHIKEKMLAEAEIAESKFGCAVLDVPLLIESGMNADCDFVLLITAGIETRYARIMKRDGLTREQAQARLSNQMPQWEKKKYADYIINNDGDEKELERDLMNAVETAFKAGGRKEHSEHDDGNGDNKETQNQCKKNGKEDGYKAE